MFCARLYFNITFEKDAKSISQLKIVHTKFFSGWAPKNKKKTFLFISHLPRVED